MSGKKLLSGAGSLVWIGILAWQLLGGLAGRDKADLDEPAAHLVVVDEQDGGELAALMQGAHEAIVARNPGQFRRLFAGENGGTLAWRRIERYQRKYGNYVKDVMTTAPVLDRALTDVHVRALVVEVWYDFSRDHTISVTPLHKTTWKFERDGSEWRLENVALSASWFEYEGMVRRLLHTPHVDMVSLDMDWEESVDPSPVLAQFLRAASRKDVAGLQRCATNGVVLQAELRDVDLPNVHNGSRFVGQMSAAYAKNALHKQIGRLQKASRRLDTSPSGLIPYFTAYRVVSMPAECTQLQMWIEFDGGGVPAPVSSFAVDWCAAFVAHKWLAISLEVTNIRSAGTVATR